MFASPDTPGMPAPSTKTAWDFLPEGWAVTVFETDEPIEREELTITELPECRQVVFSDARGRTGRGSPAK